MRLHWPMMGVTAAAVLAVAGCASASDPPPPKAGAGADPGAEPAPGPIIPPRKVSPHRPTVVVGGPLVFRRPDSYEVKSGTYKVTAYVMVFKLNRDPQVVRTAAETNNMENDNRGRGDYGLGGHDLADEGGAQDSAGKYCFSAGFSGEPAYLSAPDPLDAVKAGEPVRVNLFPKKARSTKAHPRGLWQFDVPLLVSKSKYVTDKASVRELRRIGCGPPSL